MHEHFTPHAEHEEVGTIWRDVQWLLTLVSGICLLVGVVLHYFYPIKLLSTLFYLLSILCGVWFALPKAYGALRHKKLDIHVLMIIAIVGAMGIDQWIEGATVAFLFALSLFLEHWSVGRAQKAIFSLLDQSPSVARVVDPVTGAWEEKKVELVEVSNHILVKPAEKIPLDGIVLQGVSSVDLSPITGESLPVLKDVGDEVFAGTLNGEGALLCQVTKPSKATTLARMIQLVEEARAKKSESEQWVTMFARYYTPIMLFFAVLLIVIPPLFFAQEWLDWIYRGLVLLVIACPCALVISTPVSIVCGLTTASRKGILIKGGIFLEEVGKLKAFALDKTGTLTQGHPEVQEVIPLHGYTTTELMERAVALEKLSEHPLARAVLRKGKELGIEAKSAQNYQAIKGKGALATYKETLYWIGSHRFMHEMGQESDEVHQKALALEDEGHSIIALGNDEQVCGLISIADPPRPQVKETLSELKKLGVEEIVMLTGDNTSTARALAVHAGVDRYHAELLPEEKVEMVLSLINKWEKVGMVGDGVNDAPALAAATVGIAKGGMGTDAAIETADITLMTDDLTRLPWLLRHSMRTLRIIKTNICFALGVKGLFIALALFNIATLWMAIAADTGATMLVIFNALRLLPLKLTS